MSGVIYVLTDATLKLCKVGSVAVAGNVQARIRACSYLYGVQFFFYAQVETEGDRFWIEKAVHRALREFSFRPLSLTRRKGPRELFAVRPDWARDTIKDVIETDRAIREGRLVERAEQRRRSGRFVQGDGFIMYG